jgi:hypothetical protein
MSGNPREKRPTQQRQRFAPKRMQQTIDILQRAGIAVNKVTVLGEGFTVDTAKPGDGDVLTPDDELERCRKKKDAS